MNLQEHFSEVARLLGREAPVVDYHAYSELKHTWSCRGGVLAFKVSDYLEGCPDSVSESLAWYLLCRAFRRKCPDGKADPYLSYSLSREMWVPNKERYIARARGLTLSPSGEVRDLESVFSYVNASYFDGRLAHPTLAWSKESPRTRLGFFFAPLNLLAANTVLDSARVPRYVLEFVVYHELLHHAEAGSGGLRRRVHHTRSFRDQEKAFTHYEDAERWLRRLAKEGARRRVVPQA